MGKGSQLTQLKSALQSAGLSRQSTPNQNSKSGKKRKRSNVDAAAERANKQKSLDEINRKLNPFDVKVTKLKHDVGGRNVKGVVGRPAASKQAGLEQRKRTLLPELDQRGRAGGVVDRRFGENDETLTPEERMLERFTRERQRATNKASAFNLEDDEELTHYGQSLSALDDFDGTGLALDDEPEEEGQIDRDTVNHTHFGGFEEEDEEGQPPRKKTKAEVMAEVIAKSKDYKYQRQLAKDQDDQVRNAMDREFGSIRELLFGQPIDPRSSGSNAVPLGPRAGANAPANDDDPISEATTVVLPSKPTEGEGDDDEEDDYDQVVRSLAFDQRAKPTDRTKTEEEVAAEEAERLQKAEKARLRRMQGEEASDDEEEGGARKSKKRRRAEADDLEDDFDYEGDEVGMLGKGLGEGSRVESDEDAEEDEDDEEDSGEGSEDEDEDEASEEGGEGELEDGDEEASVEGDVEELVKPSTRRGKGKGKASSAQAKSDELPYTFPCPSTHDEFLDIIEGIKESDIPTVVQRIRTIFHPSLAEGNKAKLQTLCCVLIDHVLYCTSGPDASFSLASSLTPQIFSLSKTYPSASAAHFISKLVLCQKNLLRGLSRGPTSKDAKTWPGSSELSLLRLIGVVWSTSDKDHVVGTTAELLMGQYLAQSRVRNLKDLASGLFLCTIEFQFHALSARIVPEAINFLTNVLVHLAPHSIRSLSALPGSFPSPDFERHSELAIRPKQTSSLSPCKPNLTTLLNDKNGASGEQTKVDLLAMAYELIARFAKLYGDTESWIEMFTPVLEVCGKVKVASLPSGLQKSHAALVDALTRQLKFTTQARKPLTLQAHKPIPIATYIPKFSESYSYSKRHDPDADRNSSAKLKALYRKEHKGAMRELRKDNRFLGAEQARRQAEKDDAYKKRMASVHGSIQVERAEEKAMEREKAKEQKRAGK